MPEFTGEIHYVKLAYEISEIQENCCLPWRQESADRTSMVKRELQRRWTWTWLHIRKSVALQPGNMIHMPAIYHLPSSSRLFLDGDPFLPLFHEHLARAWCNILCLRDKPAKSTGGLKNVAADCCAHSTLCFIDFCHLYSDDSNGSSKDGFGSETFPHNSARRKGKLRSTRKEYYSVLPEITSTVSHILELHDLLLN